MTYLEGGHVEFVELFIVPGEETYARTRSSYDLTGRKNIASAGFAIEVMLYQAGRIGESDASQISESAFIADAMAHAMSDKASFFGGDFVEADGAWPADMDVAFMRYAMQHVVPRLAPHMLSIEALARNLSFKTRMEREEIERFIPDEIRKGSQEAPSTKRAIIWGRLTGLFRSKA